MESQVLDNSHVSTLSGMLDMANSRRRNDVVLELATTSPCRGANRTDRGVEGGGLGKGKIRPPC